METFSREKKKLEKLFENLSRELKHYEKLKDTPYPYQLWQRIPRCNLKLQELKPNYYFDAINDMEKFFLTEEPLFKNMGTIYHSESSKSFLWRVLKNLKNSTSVVALNEGNLLEIAGILVLVEVARNSFSRTMSREDIVLGQSHCRYVKLTSKLMYEIDLFSLFDCFMFLRIYALCIKPQYRHMGLGLKFFETAIDVAQSLKIPVIMGVFTDSCMQVLGKKVGMQEMGKINYCDWKDFDGRHIFHNLRQDHRTCSLMAGKVPPPPENSLTLPLISLENPPKKNKKKKKKK